MSSCICLRLLKSGNEKEGTEGMKFHSEALICLLQTRSLSFLRVLSLPNLSASRVFSTSDIRTAQQWAPHQDCPWPWPHKHSPGLLNAPGMSERPLPGCFHFPWPLVRQVPVALRPFSGSPGCYSWAQHLWDREWHKDRNKMINICRATGNWRQHSNVFRNCSISEVILQMAAPRDGKNRVFPAHPNSHLNVPSSTWWR